MERKYYYEACEHCSELDHCDIANVTNEEQPHVWSCDDFHWDESKLQSPQGQAPPLHQKGEVAKAETCITCIKHNTPQCQYKDEEMEVEGCSFHRSEQSHLQGEVGGLEKGD